VNVRFVLRGLLRSPGFTTVAVLTLAIGIAGVTVMASLIRSVLLQPLPVDDQDRLIVAWKRPATESFGHQPFGADAVRAVKEHARLFESAAAFGYNGAMQFVTVESGVAAYTQVAAVGGDFFAVLGTEPLLGRTLAREDDVSGAEHVLVIDESLWRRRYGESRDVIGRRVMVQERPFTVVGVVANLDLPRGAEAWMSLRTFTEITPNPFRIAGERDHDLLARLRPGVSVEQARAELTGILREVDSAGSQDLARGSLPFVQLYPDLVHGNVRAPMFLLAGAVALVLLIASANLSNLMLMRAEARRVERALRAALGQNRAGLVAEVVLECTAIGLAAAILAFGVTWSGLRLVVALGPTELSRIDAAPFDWLVILSAVLLAVLTAIVAGLLPSVLLARRDLVTALGQSGRLVAPATRIGRRALVVAQVGLAVVILAGAGVLTRTLLQLQTIDMGMATDRLVFVELFFPKEKYADAVRTRAFFEELLTRVRAIPGVEAASQVGVLPVAGLSGWDTPRFAAEGQGPEEAAGNPALNLEEIYPDHFQTLGVQLLRGRAFTTTDTEDTPNVAVISDDVAQRVWPGQDPIGKRLKMGGVDSTDSWFTVVGVARPTRYRELVTPRPTLYVAASQFINAGKNLALRTTASSDVVAGAVRESVRSIDADVHVLRTEPFSTFLKGPLARPRFVAWLSDIFGATSLLLAAVGLYAVMAAFVRQGRREIGVRVALGAGTNDVRRLVLAEATSLAGLGVLLGLTAAVATSSILRELVFGVSPIDPASLSGAVILLALTVGAACYFPLRRAARIDPVELLRAE
jgi:putative ABC transport system permease protein